jgi:hypothetical protein
VIFSHLLNVNFLSSPVGINENSDENARKSGAMQHSHDKYVVLGGLSLSASFKLGAAFS